MALPGGTLVAIIPDTGLLFGLMLVAAIIGGYLAHAARVPRVVGYLLAGAVLKSGFHHLLAIEPGSPQAHELAASEAPLKAVKDLGLGLILFSIGGVFEVRHLKAAGRSLFKIAAAESGLTFLLVFAGTALAGLLSAGTLPTSTLFSFALLLGLASIATAPAATLFVLNEYDAKGPVTDTVLSLTGLNNVTCIVAFNVAFLALAATGALGAVTLSAEDVWFELALSTLGSVLLGLVLGFALSIIHAKLQFAETLLIFIAVLIVLGNGEQWLLKHQGVSYNALLTALCMGAVFTNAAIDPDKLQSALDSLGRPVLVGFFVLAGYELHVADLPRLGLIGGAYVACRMAGKIVGARLGRRWARQNDRVRAPLGAALLCQAAVVIGLADFVGTHWLDEWAARSFVSTVLGSVVIFEVCGPILTKWVVVRAGEVKAVTLLRRAAAPVAGGASTLALTGSALLRTIGLGRSAAPASKETLLVRHIMRTNVKCIPAATRLDEVLHFIERSRYNHFPVIDEDEELIGVIHFSQIREIIYDPTMADLVTAVDIADPDTQAVPVDMPLNETLEVFRKGDVGSLPVVESLGSRRVVGIVEQRDLLRAMHLSRDVA